jgi:hypothetical protein
LRNPERGYLISYENDKKLLVSPSTTTPDDDDDGVVRYFEPAVKQEK